MSKGSEYVVFVYLDNSERIAASSRLDRFLSKEPATSPKEREWEMADGTKNIYHHAFIVLNVADIAEGFAMLIDAILSAFLPITYATVPDIARSCNRSPAQYCDSTRRRW